MVLSVRSLCELASLCREIASGLVYRCDQQLKHVGIGLRPSTDRLTQNLSQEIGSMRETTFQKGIPVIRGPDRYTFRTGGSDVNRALRDTDRSAVTALRTIRDRHHRSRSVGGDNDDRIGDAFELGPLHEDLQTWLEVSLHDRRDRILAE